MSVEERSRRNLYDLLKEPLGMVATNALLDELPPVGSDLATRDDINLLRAELHSEIADVRADMKVLRAEIDARLAGLSQQIAELGATLSKQQVRLFLGMLGFVVALVVGIDGPWAH